MSRIVFENETVIPGTQSTDQVALFFESNQLKSKGDDGVLRLYSTGVTPEEVQDIVGSFIVQGTGTSIVYDDVANTLTISSTITQYTDELAQDAIASLIQNGTGITWVYNDSLNTLTGTVSLSSFTTSNLSEGTNLYYTDARARASISVTDSSTIDFTYSTGNITASVIVGAVDHNSLLNYVANRHIDHSAVSIIAGTGLIGGGDLTATRTISMPNVGTASTYGSATQVAVVTTDAQGRVSGASSTSIAIPSTQITDFSESVDDRVASLLVAGDGIDLTYSDVGNSLTIAVTPRTITNLTSSTALSTTSATFATLTTMTTTPAAGAYLVLFSCSASIDADSSGDFGLFIAGVEQADTRRAFLANTSGAGTTNISGSVAINTMITVNGSQVVDIRYRENGGGTLSVAAREMILIPT
jgi:hypothetical protein